VVIELPKICNISFNNYFVESKTTTRRRTRSVFSFWFDSDNYCTIGAYGISYGKYLIDILTKFCMKY
jgi:hypothetical protein